MFSLFFIPAAKTIKFIFVIIDSLLMHTLIFASPKLFLRIKIQIIRARKKIVRNEHFRIKSICTKQLACIDVQNAMQIAHSNGAVAAIFLRKYV